jgi:hypothetical protein
MGGQGPHRRRHPQRGEQAPGLGGDALATDLVAREAGLVEQDDVVSALLQHHGHGRPGRTSAHDDGVAG